MTYSYFYRTKAGRFTIELALGRWQVYFENENLGNYATAELALDDLVGGHTWSASCGDTSKLGLPSQLSEWTRRST